MKIAAVAIFKNEAPFLREWIAYHRCIGIDEFVLYDNESTDAGADTVSHWPGVTVFPWPQRPGQIPAYTHFHANYGTHYDWAAFIDIDEFINPFTGDIRTLLSRAAIHSAMLLNWLSFGPNDHGTRPAGLVIENYTMRLPVHDMCNRGVKSIVRMSDMTGAWSPHHQHVSGVVCDPDGKTVPNDHEPRTCHSNAVINHYYTRSRQDWAEKLARGRADTDVVSEQRLWSWFDIYRANSTECDNTMVRRGEAVRREIQSLDSRGRMRDCQGLVMDVGVSEGNDTAYYLAKGFRLIAVEADPNICRSLRLRFESEIVLGSLTLLNFAAGTKFGESVEFFVHDQHQHLSSIYKREGVDPARYSAHLVPTIDYRTLIAQAGVPRYLKIDIEGQEEQFLAGMVGQGDVPEFISIEAYKFRPCEMLFEMGYRRFKLVDQNPPGGFRLPIRQLEGLSVETANFTYGSGPFGLDLFGDGDWLDFKAFEQAWLDCKPRMSQTWFDCHAWKPN